MNFVFELVDGSVHEFTMEGDKFIVGRSSKCDIHLPYEGFSRQHCQITIEDGQIFLTDLGSTNGVFINDKRINANEKTPYPDFLPLSMGAAVSVSIQLVKKEASVILELDKPITQTGIVFQKPAAAKSQYRQTRAPIRKPLARIEEKRSFGQYIAIGLVVIAIIGVKSFFEEEEEDLDQMMFEANVSDRDKDGSVKTVDF